MALTAAVDKSLVTFGGLQREGTFESLCSITENGQAGVEYEKTYNLIILVVSL